MSQFEPKHKRGTQFTGLSSLESWWKMVADNFEDLTNGVVGWSKSHSESTIIDHADGSVTEQKLSEELQAKIVDWDSKPHSNAGKNLNGGGELNLFVGTSTEIVTFKESNPAQILTTIFFEV